MVESASGKRSEHCGCAVSQTAAPAQDQFTTAWAWKELSLATGAHLTASALEIISDAAHLARISCATLAVALLRISHLRPSRHRRAIVDSQAAGG